MAKGQRLLRWSDLSWFPLNSHAIFPQMPDYNATPQFGTAEYRPQPAPDSCKLCGQPVGAQYYRVGEALACPSCAERVQREGPKDSHAAFTQALVFGIGGAIAGLILYATFVILTDVIIGYVSLAVGWIVAKAMMKGSQGIGGRRYQVTAALLTYAAVSLAYIPIVISYAIKHRPPQQQVRTVDRAPSGEQSDNSQSQASSKPKISRGQALWELTKWGLASPFLLLFRGTGFISFFILLIGIRLAWKIAEGKPETTVYGPFANAPAR